jgi:hypothetical protein
MIKVLKKLGINGMHLNTMKITRNPKGHIARNGKPLKPFTLNSAMRQGFLLSSLLFSMMLEFLNKPIRQAKK